MIINTNTSSLRSYNALTSTNNALQKLTQRLSTGLRVNSAADDAAGLAISEKMRAQIRGLDRATANAQDGISMIQTAEGAYNEIHSILQRMRELSVQAANDTLTANDREYIQLEIDELKGEIDRISTTTQFNKKKLLDGSSDALWSSSDNGVRVKVKGSLLSQDAFGQTVLSEGNYRVVVRAEKAGQGQVLKSNVFKHASQLDGDGEDDIVGRIAGKSSYLAELSNFIDGSGRFILDTPQTLTVSFENGGSSSITIYQNDTVGSLGDKLNEAMKAASGVYDEGSLIQWVGEDSVVSGDPSVLFEDNEEGRIAEKILTGWLGAAADRIKDYYGIEGAGNTKLEIVWSDLPNPGYIGAAAGGPDHVTIYLNPDYWNTESSLYGNWEDAQSNLLHELTHGMQFCTNIGDLMGGGMVGHWLGEGMTEYIAGGARRVQGYHSGNDLSIATNLANMMVHAMGDASGAGKGTGQEWYCAGYLAVRYYDEMSTAAGGGGIKALLAELNKASLPPLLSWPPQAGYEAALNAAMDAAIAATSTFADYEAFRSALTDTSDPGWTNFYDFTQSVLAEDLSVDSGLLGGLYASGGSPVLWNESLAGGGRGYQGNPLEDFGYSLVEIFGKVYDDFAARQDDSSLASSMAVANALQSVEGTLLLHSNIAGAAGRMIVSGDEDLLKALGFAEVQEAEDTIYRISIYDAHTNKIVVSDEKISGNDIIGLLHANIDIEMRNNFALEVDGTRTLSNGYGSFLFNAESGEFFVHIAATATILQVGANEGESFALSFGDASARALGVDQVKVTDRESASRAITVVDGAIATVSDRRARLGAYQNRLEHTVNNLTTASSNMTASESRIRDLDFAKEMMSFAKLNILSQAGNSMLAQANQMPQNVLTLLR